MPIYVKYGDIKGGTTTEGYKEMVEFNSLQFGIGRGIASPTGTKTNRESSQPSISEVVMSKSLDESSYRWFEESCTGEGVDCEIYLTRTAQGQTTTYQKYTLSDCLVSGYSVSSGGDRPSESISINFSKIISDQTLGDADNKDGTAQKAGWDLATMKKV